MSDSAAPPAAAPPPPTARTTPTLVVGGNDKDAVDFYKLPKDSPIADSFQFIDFEKAGDHLRVERSALLGAILSPTWPSPSNTTTGSHDITMLHGLYFLEYELKTLTVKRILNELDASGVFSTVFKTTSDWEEAIPSIIENLNNPDALCVKAGDFDRSDWLERVPMFSSGPLISAVNAVWSS